MWHAEPCVTPDCSLVVFRSTARVAEVSRVCLKGCLAGLMLSLAPIVLADLPAHAAAATLSCPHHGETACRAGRAPAHPGRASRIVHVERGEASWYGPRFAGRR